MERLEKLITRFLEFARLDLRIMTPQPEVLNVLEECRQVLDLLQPLAEAKEIALETDFAPEVPALRADPLLLRRVLQNLLENAIKFSPGRSQVRLEVRVEDPAIRFAVYDQGPGIAADDLAHVFEIFYRGQREGDTQGFGLGLATVKRIIDASRRPHLGGHGPRPRLHLLLLRFPWGRQFLRMLPAGNLRPENAITAGRW